jgi:hypothetical protein
VKKTWKRPQSQQFKTSLILLRFWVAKEYAP